MELEMQTGWFTEIELGRMTTQASDLRCFFSASFGLGWSLDRIRQTKGITRMGESAARFIDEPAADTALMSLVPQVP